MTDVKQLYSPLYKLCAHAYQKQPTLCQNDHIINSKRHIYIFFFATSWKKAMVAYKNHKFLLSSRIKQKKIYIYTHTHMCVFAYIGRSIAKGNIKAENLRVGSRTRIHTRIVKTHIYCTHFCRTFHNQRVIIRWLVYLFVDRVYICTELNIDVV